MCSIITIDNDTIKPARLKKYLERETMFNDDGMVVQLQDKYGHMSSLKTFELDTAMAFIQSNDWTRMWMHMRAATQGEVNLRNVHGWMTTDGTAVMHNGILSDKDSWQFNVDSELIVEWLESLGLSYTLDMLKGERYANVFMIKNTGDYIISRTAGGTLFTDNNGNFSTNAVGRINRPVKHGFQKVFLNNFVAPDVKRLVETAAESAYDRYLNSSNYWLDKAYDREYEIHGTSDLLPSTEFNDTGKLDGFKPTAEQEYGRTSDEAYEKKREELTRTWDAGIDREEFTDDEYREYLDEGRLTEFENAKKRSS